MDDFVKDSQKIVDQMTNELVKPILNQDSEKNSPTTSRNTDPLVRPPRPTIPPMYHDPSRDPLRDPLRDIGRGDLDPFGRGGGMIFQPNFRPEFNPLNPLSPSG